MGVRHTFASVTHLSYPCEAQSQLHYRCGAHSQLHLGLCEYMGQSTLQNRVVISGKVFEILHLHDYP